MNLVAGAQTFPVLVGRDPSLERSKDAVLRMEAQGQGDLAAVLWRNLVISWGLCTVDALLLTLHVQEVLNFDWWERERAAKGVPVQDWVVDWEMDCFRGLIVSDCVAVRQPMLEVGRPVYLYQSNCILVILL